jgi:hypothetical protein
VASSRRIRRCTEKCVASPNVVRGEVVRKGGFRAIYALP